MLTSDVQLPELDPYEYAELSRQLDDEGVPLDPICVGCGMAYPEPDARLCGACRLEAAGIVACDRCEAAERATGDTLCVGCRTIVDVEFADLSR